MQKIQPEILTDAVLCLYAGTQLMQNGYMRVSYQREVLKRFETRVNSTLAKQIELPI